jgi:L-cysteate sulfo-lyase
MVARGGDECDRNGNVLLDDLFGARIHDLPAGVDSTHFAQERSDELRAAGHIASVATLGGSSPTGCVGYADCALEIRTQSNDLEVYFAAIVVPNGSSGTQAGLVAGYRALRLDTTRVRSRTGLAPAASAIAATVEKPNSALTLLGFEASLSSNDIRVSGDQLGPGFGLSTPALVEAVRLMARREGDASYGSPVVRCRRLHFFRHGYLTTIVLPTMHRQNATATAGVAKAVRRRIRTRVRWLKVPPAPCRHRHANDTNSRRPE